MLSLAGELLAGSLTTTADDTARAVQTLMVRNRIVAEGAGAAAVAVALSGRAGAGRIACVVSGGNIDAHKLAKILDGEQP